MGRFEWKVLKQRELPIQKQYYVYPESCSFFPLLFDGFISRVITLSAVCVGVPTQSTQSDLIEGRHLLCGHVKQEP